MSSWRLPSQRVMLDIEYSNKISEAIHTIWVASRRNTQKDLCAQRRLSSTWASQCAQCVAEDPIFLRVDSEDWSDRAHAQAGQSLRWAQRSFCWFCHEAAHLLVDLLFYHPVNLSTRKCKGITTISISKRLFTAAIRQTDSCDRNKKQNEKGDP